MVIRRFERMVRAVIPWGHLRVVFHVKRRAPFGETALHLNRGVSNWKGPVLGVDANLKQGPPSAYGKDEDVTDVRVRCE